METNANLSEGFEDTVSKLLTSHENENKYFSGDYRQLPRLYSKIVLQTRKKALNFD